MFREINKKIALVANFGTVYTGLSTVGYKLWNGDGTQFQARTTTGVSEIRAGTGAYKVEVANSVFTADFDGYVEWDTGGGSPVYAYDDIHITAQLDAAVSSRSTYAGADTAGTTTLLSRLTSTRAGNLDFLDTAVSGIAAAVWAVGTRSLTTFGTLVADIWAAVADSAGVTTLLSRLTSGRATKLDNLDATVSSRATQTSVDTVAGYVDTEVGTIRNAE